MPAYNNDPTQSVPMLLSKVPFYFAGTPPTPGPNCRMLITSDSVSSNVVTLTVAVVEGNIPAVGDLIYVYATSNSAGALNQKTGIAIASVTINATTGIGTVTYAKTVANQGATADTGYAISIPQPAPEALVANQAYRAVAIEKRDDESPDRSFVINVQFPTLDGGASLKFALQGAMSNYDAEFVTFLGDLTAAGTYSDSGAPGAQSSTGQFWPSSWRFIRFKDTGSTGIPATTVIAKVLMM